MFRTLLLVAAYLPSVAAVREAGPGKPYAAPCAAIAAASPGDTIEIDAAGNYSGDVCAWTTGNLTIRGVRGRPVIDAAGRSSQGKAIWVIAGNDTVIENIEFTNARVPDRNGAGLRQEGRNLTVRYCYFHDNDEGILTGQNTSSEILIEYSEFARNGYGDGQSHNLYIGNVAKFTLRFSYSHHAVAGHLVKSRAAENHILYNRLTGETGTGSYELDLPNGGTSRVIGNLIQQGPNTGNSSMVAYREEGGSAGNPGTSLYVVNNTFVNERPAGAVFVFAGSGSAPAVIRNNIFAGPGTVTNQAGALLAANLTGVDPLFADPASYDYRLRSGSPAANAGADPGAGLAPQYQYVHPACGETRAPSGNIDIGAWEYGGGGTRQACSPGTVSPPSAFTPIRVNAGGPAVTDSAGNLWSADTGFSGGSVYSTPSTIAGTATPALYQTERYSGAPLQYRFQVPAGTYTVRLKFAEIYYTSAGKRIFDIAINGQTVRNNFDIAAAGGPMAAVDLGYPVTVSDGAVTILLTPVVENAQIGAIEIVEGLRASVAVSPAAAALGPSRSQQFTAAVSGTTSTGVVWTATPAGTGVLTANGNTATYTAPTSIPVRRTVTVTAASVADATATGSAAVTLVPPASQFTPIRINAGGGAYTDPSGTAWSADSGSNGGNTYSTRSRIAGTNTPVLYQTERYSPSPLRYTFAVPAGTYTVKLKFAEIYFTSAGKRVFNIAINGQTVKMNFDIFAAAGALTAADLSFPAAVSGNQIVVALSPVVENAKISAIEIVKQ